MTTIDKIITTINALPIDGQGALSLKPSDFSIPFMDSVFAQMLGASSLNIGAAVRKSDATSISVAGTADVLGYTQMTCDLAFAEKNAEVVATITLIFAPTKAITLPLITWVKTNTIVLSASITETFALVGTGFSMNLLLENGDIIPIGLHQQTGTEWRLDIAEGTDQKVTANDIVYLLGGATLDGFFPKVLTDALDGFSLNGVETIFDTQQKTVTYFTTGVSVTNGWPIAPKVSLKPGLQLGLTLVNPTDKANRVTIGSLAATFDIAGVAIPILAGATATSDGSTWTLGLQPGKTVTLPSFSDLLELAGGTEFIATLPSGLSDIPKIEIDTLSVAFEPAKKELTQLSFALQTASSWPVIENYFTIQQFQIAFDITDLTDPTKRLILGDLYAVFLVGSVALMCEIQKTAEKPDWTITAGLAPGTVLNLTQVAAKLFEGKVTLPDDVPQISFDVLSITVVPEKKSFDFKAGSNSPWKLIGDKLVIDKIGVAFARTQTGTDSSITGQVASTLTICGVELTLKASLNDTKNSGWQFSGSTGTQPIPIGTLIKELAGIFGDVPLPSVLTGLSVYNLAVDFNTTSKDFTFHCVLKDTALPHLTVDVDIIITHKTKTEYQTEFKGTALYKTDTKEMEFVLDFVEVVADKDKASTTIATYKAVSPPTLSELVQAVSKGLGFESALPGALNIDAALTELKLQLVKTDKDPLKIEAAGVFELTFGPGDVWELYLSYTNDGTFEVKEVKSRALAASGKPAYVFGIALNGGLDLSKLPLVGSIPGVDDFKIDKLGFYYTDAVFTKDNNKLLFAVAELDGAKKLAPTPAAAFLDQPQFNLMALFGNKKDAAANQTPNAMPLGTATTPIAPSAAQDAPPAFDQKQADPRKPITWLPLNKTLGPVELSKVGLGYEAPGKDDKGMLGIVGLYVDGAFSVGGLSMVLDRLGITFPIPMPGGHIDNPLSKVGFHLGGMFLEYKAPSFEIAGGFVNLPGDSVNMIGEFIVQAGPFGLQGYGGYADTLGHPSLFVFLHLEAPIGGPPFFFVTGVSGGFGVNRGFKLPSFSELTTYPLLPSNPSIPTAAGLSGKSNEDKLNAMTQSLLSLAKYFPVEDGEYWFAVGLDVTSFEMIEVSVILSVSFGVNLQIAVIGSAIMSLPVKVPEPIAYVQINFIVSYSSSDNLLAVMGVITPASYIYAGLVKLSGGFAFYTWLAGEHSGDFVLTVGGYSPHFKPPAHYPNVPRMEMRAGIGIVNMVGQAYFALTPHMLMAGLDFKATADLGPISAWFDANIDFIIGWKPFFYEAEAGIQIGASFTIDLGFVKAKITIHVGVMLEIWGPSFGGRARVDLDIISFTINFGDQAKPAPKLNWDEFKEFLPSVPAPKEQQQPRFASMAFAAEPEPAPKEDADKPLVNLVVKSGLVKAFAAGEEVDGLNWIVDANHFDIRTHSTAPCTDVIYNNVPLPANYNYLVPGDLHAQIIAPDHKGQEPPYYVYKTPKDQIDWFTLKFGIPPMEKTDIKSTHKVTLNKLTDGHGTLEDAFIITLQTGGVPPALWGNDPVSDKTATTSDETVIKNALVGLQFTPMVWSPKRTTFIPYYYLVFNTNNLFLEQVVAPQINQTPFPNPDAIAAAMQDGTAFAKTQGARTSIVDTLKANGFAHLNLSNSGALSTQDYVADPAFTYMSSTPETNVA